MIEELKYEPVEDQAAVPEKVFVDLPTAHDIRVALDDLRWKVTNCPTGECPECRSRARVIQWLESVEEGCS